MTNPAGNRIREKIVLATERLAKNEEPGIYWTEVKKAPSMTIASPRRPNMTTMAIVDHLTKETHRFQMKSRVL
jgi:hypothetical protein